jgi:hypothetical protein
MYGFDTAGSLGEETVDPRRTAPTAILRAIIASFVIGGLILLFGILAAPDLADPALGTTAGGLQLIVLQALGSTYLLVTGPMLVKRLRGEWPGPDAGRGGCFSLGRWGLPVNILAVVWGAAMALNLAWPRADVYGESFRWIAFIFIGLVAALGLAWCFAKGRHQVGTLPEHMARNMEGAADGTQA